MTGNKQKGNRIEIDRNDEKTRHSTKINGLEPDFAATTVMEIADLTKPNGFRQATYLHWQNPEDNALETIKTALKKVHTSKASSYEKHTMTKFITKRYMNNRQM